MKIQFYNQPISGQAANLLKKHESNEYSKQKSQKNRDSFSISSDASMMLESKVSMYDNCYIDQIIDIEKYINNAKKQNQLSLENAGNNIDITEVKYHDLFSALRSALNEKYSIVSRAAKNYSNVDEYLNDKYFNKNSSIYTRGLSEEERRVGYINERSYLDTGHIRGINFSDSLFRGKSFDGDVIDTDRLNWESKVINKQIDNIFTSAGIKLEDITDNCLLSIDPYSKYVSVSGIDDTQKELLEKSLNTGNNGKNLFLYLYKHTSLEDEKSGSQAKDEARIKYQAYARVYELTGLSLSQLDQKEGSFVTQDGKNLLDVIDENIESKIDINHQEQMRQWIKELLYTVASKGWNNIPDLLFNIRYKNNLSNLNQDIIYGRYNTSNNEWYSVL